MLIYQYYHKFTVSGFIECIEEFMAKKFSDNAKALREKMERENLSSR